MWLGVKTHNNFTRFRIFSKEINELNKYTSYHVYGDAFSSRVALETIRFCRNRLNLDIVQVQRSSIKLQSVAPIVVFAHRLHQHCVARQCFQTAIGVTYKLVYNLEVMERKLDVRPLFTVHGSTSRGLCILRSCAANPIRLNVAFMRRVLDQ